MSDSTLQCRWPPVYDFEELGSQINKLVSREEIFDVFFLSQLSDEILCQGDILKFPGQFPFVDQDGNIQILEEEYDYWIILGNTCDLQRDLDPPSFTHIVPLVPLVKEDPESTISGLRSYDSWKRFYIPNWDSIGELGFYINFTCICSIDKKCLSKNTELSARLTRTSWVLLHSCLVRYLARDDGRHD